LTLLQAALHDEALPDEALPDKALPDEVLFDAALQAALALPKTAAAAAVALNGKRIVGVDPGWRNIVSLFSEYATY
jgi:hypothetical protein